MASGRASAAHLYVIDAVSAMTAAATLAPFVTLVDKGACAWARARTLDARAGRLPDCGLTDCGLTDCRTIPRRGGQP